ncbi:MAG: hypothetical protein ACON5A_01980 [Candidatus Comchoanobacterales bacterium]
MMNRSMKFIFGGAAIIIVSVTALYFYGQYLKENNIPKQDNQKDSTPNGPDPNFNYICMTPDELKSGHFDYCPSPRSLFIDNNRVKTTPNAHNQWSSSAPIFFDNTSDVFFKGATFENNSIICSYEKKEGNGFTSFNIKNTKTIDRPSSKLGNWSNSQSQPQKMTCIPTAGTSIPVCACVFHYQEDFILDGTPLSQVIKETPKSYYNSNLIFQVFQQTGSSIAIKK